MDESLLATIHLCDSLFPIGAFAYSDGMEAAVHLAATGACNGSSRHHGLIDSSAASVDFLRRWIDVVLDEAIGRLDGPAVWSAWRAAQEDDWPAIATLDEELTALRPSKAGRRSNRALGLRLLTTWSALRPEPRLARALAQARAGRIAPGLPVAFALVCVTAGIEREESLAAYAYTRLAATTSAAMRLLPIGQTEAHRLLVQALDRLPAVARAIARRDGPPESFAPMLDIACMSQQYLHSRLFRS
jgi:urease accessory protein